VSALAPIDSATSGQRDLLVTIMTRARDTIAIARDLIDRHGGAAPALVDQRVRDNLAAGDAEAAAFWSQVAQAVRALRGI
jgi:hypothetical protein